MASDSLTRSLRETLSVFDPPGVPRTTSEVADRLGVGRRSTYERLERLVEQDRLETKKVGASARVWWRPATRDASEPGQPAAEFLVEDVLDGVEVGIFVLDEDLEVAWANEAVERYFGLDRERAVGRDKRELVDERIAPVVDDSETFAETVLATYEDNSYAERFECRVTADEEREARWLEHRSKPIETGAYAGGRVELYYDITARKRSERVRQEDREEFASLVEAVEEYAIFTLDTEGYVRTWNPGAERIKGYAADEIVGEHFSTFYTEAAREAGVPERNLAAATAAGSVEDEGWRVRKDGSRFWANVTITAIRDDDGELQGYAKVTRDMTERREHERQLRRERNLVEKVFDTVPVGIGVVTASGDVVRANERANELLRGVGDLAAEDRRIYDADGEPVPPEERPFGRVIRTGEPVHDWQCQIEYPDGERRWLSMNAAPLDADGDGVDRVVVSGEDITQFREQARRLERQRDDLRDELGEVFTRIDEAFFALDGDWRITHVNDQAAELVNLSPGELVGAVVWDVLPEVAEGHPREAAERAMETGEPVEFEFYSEILDVWVEIRGYPSETGMSVYVRDVTERKEREQELQRFETIVQTVNDGIYVVDEDGYYTFANEEVASMLGVPVEDLVGAHVSDAVDPDTVSVGRDVDRELREGDSDAITVEVDITNAETGEVRHAEATFTLLPDSGERVAVVRDVTERKRREQEVREAKLQLEAATEAGAVGTWEWHVQEDRFVAGPSLARTFGVDPDAAREGVPLERFTSRIHHADRDDVQAEIEAALDSCGEYEAEYRVRNVDGELRWVVARGHVECDQDGTPTTFPGALIDITRRKERERELERTRGLLEQTGRIAGVGGWEIDTDTMEVFWTDNLFDILGVDDEEEPPLEEALDVYHEEDRPVVEDAIDAALAAGEPFDVEVRIRRPDDEVRWLRVQGTPATEGGEVVTLRGSAQDVTERKERERELEEYRRWNETLVENFPGGAVALVDEDFRYVLFGGTPVESPDVTREDLEGAPVRESLPEATAEIVVPRYEAALDGEASEFEETVDGRVYQFRFVPVRDDDGDVFAAAAISQDITERKRRERELERQREQLAALNNLNRTVREITDAAIEQSTREEIERTVCEHLAGTDSYRFAWIGEVDTASQTVALRTEAGVEGYLDDITISVEPDEAHGEGPTGRALRTGEIQIVRDVHADPAYEPWREYAEAYGFRASAAVPIQYEGTVYGVLNVYADRPDAFAGQERDVIAQLGEVVGHAIAAIERKQALMSDELVELDFRIPDVFEALDAPVETDGTIALDHTVPVGDGEFLVYGTATPDALEAVRGLVSELPHWESVTVRSEGDPVEFELRLSDPPVLSIVAAHGGYVDDAVIEDGDYRMTVHLAPSVDVRRIIDAIGAAYPRVEMVSRRQISRDRGELRDVQRYLETELTDRQRTALEVAYHAGFFEWPRASTAEEVAASLEIAPSTFHQHLRKGERKVFDAVFDSAA